MIHIVDHMDYTDATTVVTVCGLAVHVNDPCIQLVDSSTYKKLDEAIKVSQGCETCEDLASL